MLYIYPYKSNSKSAKTLAKQLNIKRIKHSKSHFKAGIEKTVINWGSSSLPQYIERNCSILNNPEIVKICTDKRIFFEYLSQFNPNYFPPFTTNPKEALSWLEKNKIVVARTVLKGSSGAGIVLIEDEDTFVQAPLYTQYIPKKEEYRVHIFNNEIIDIQRKARLLDVDDAQVNWKIRNLCNGFIYARENINPPDAVLSMSLDVMEQLGLHFGAIDIIWNEKRKRPYVLEVNTAPGLERTTLDIYVNAFNMYK